MAHSPLPRLRSTPLLGVLALALALSTTSADASVPALSIGEVTTRVTRKEVDLPSAFRSAVEVELNQVDLRDVRKRERLVVSASLIRLDTETKDGRAHTTCVVSATLRKARGGALLAILQGKARAEDTARQVPSNEMAALRAAVHSAVVGIPTAMRE